MLDKYLIVRECEEDNAIYVNGVERTLDEAHQWIHDDKNFNDNNVEYSIYKKVEES